VTLSLEHNVKVAELMQTDVKAVRPDATVADVITSLADGHVSAVPVVDGHGRMIGVVSSSDVLTQEAEAGDRPARSTLLEDTLASDIMTPQPLTIDPEADVRDAARQMLYADVHRLFVVSADRLAGVISTTDIVRAVATGRL
jgi:CBS domain-containing protein